MSFGNLLLLLKSINIHLRHASPRNSFVCNTWGKKLIMKKCKDDHISLWAWITWICHWLHLGLGEKTKKDLAEPFPWRNLWCICKCPAPQVFKQNHGAKENTFAGGNILWWVWVLNTATPPVGKGKTTKQIPVPGVEENQGESRFFIMVGKLILICVEKLAIKTKSGTAEVWVHEAQKHICKNILASLNSRRNQGILG